MPTHRFPASSARKLRLPIGDPAFSKGNGYSFTLPVLGSSFPRISSPKLSYQTIPSESTITSCGCLVSFGRSYSVMMTCVALPVGRGNVLSEYVQLSPLLRLMLLINSPVACSSCCWWLSPPPPRSC